MLTPALMLMLMLWRYQMMGGDTTILRTLKVLPCLVGAKYQTNSIWEGVRSWSSLSAGRRHFSSARKKQLWCTKSIPNDIVECMGQEFYKKKHRITCFRWSGAVLTFCSLKKLLLLQKKFIPRWRWSTNFKFVYQKNHTSSGVLSLLYSPVNDFLPGCTLAPPGFTFLGGIWNRWL